MTSPRTEKPELYLLSRQDSLSPEKLAILFAKLTGKPATAEEAKAAMDGAESRAAEFQKHLPQKRHCTGAGAWAD